MNTYYSRDNRRTPSARSMDRSELSHVVQRGVGARLLGATVLKSCCAEPIATSCLPQRALHQEIT
jgi:hypothetical protein